MGWAGCGGGGGGRGVGGGGAAEGGGGGRRGRRAQGNLSELEEKASVDALCVLLFGERLFEESAFCAGVFSRSEREA